MAAGTGNKTRMEAALEKLRANVDALRRVSPGRKKLTDAEEKALLVETFGADRADAIFADWQRRGKAADDLQIGHKGSNEDFSQPPADRLIMPDAMGFYPAGQYAKAMEQRRELAEQAAPALKAQAGVKTHGFWNTEYTPEKPKQQVKMAHHPMWRTLVPASSLEPGKVTLKARGSKALKEYPIAGMQLQDAIDAMTRALELPQALVDTMQRQLDMQRVYDILKMTIEQQGGTIEFNLEVKP